MMEDKPKLKVNEPDVVLNYYANHGWYLTVDGIPIKEASLYENLAPTRYFRNKKEAIRYAVNVGLVAE